MKSSVDALSCSARAEMHRARWGPRFDQMDKTLSEEEEQLVSAKRNCKIISKCNDVAGVLI